MPARRLVTCLATLLVTTGVVLALLAGPALAAGPAADSTACVPPPVAHRGASAGAPENTRPAFARALAAGARILEMDVRFTADGVPVVLHDATVARTTNGRGAVATMSLATLRRLDAGSWFSRAYRGTTVPTLWEVLGDGKRYHASYLVELKVVPTTEQLRRLLGRFNGLGVSDRVTVTSFHPEALSAVRAAQPTMRTALIDASTPRPPDAVLAMGTSYLPNVGAVTPDAVARWRGAGISVYPWTVGRQATWARLAADGVAAVITNRPAPYLDWARRVCAR